MSVREGEGERERPLGLNPPEGTRRQYEKSFNRNRSGEVCLKFKRQHGHDVRCWSSFFFLFLMFFFAVLGADASPKVTKKRRKNTQRDLFFITVTTFHRAEIFFFFFFKFGDTFLFSRVNSVSFIDGGWGCAGVCGREGGREGGVVGARIAEPRTP